VTACSTAQRYTRSYPGAYDAAGVETEGFICCLFNVTHGSSWGGPAARGKYSCEIWPGWTQFRYIECGCGVLNLGCRVVRGEYTIVLDLPQRWCLPLAS